MTVDPNFVDEDKLPDTSIETKRVTKFNPKTTAGRDYWQEYFEKLHAGARFETIIESIAREGHPRDAAVVVFPVVLEDELRDRVAKQNLVVLEPGEPARGNEYNALGTVPNVHFYEVPDTIKQYERRAGLVLIGHEHSQLEALDAKLRSDGEEDYVDAAVELGVPSCCASSQYESQSEGDVDRFYESVCRTESAYRSGTGVDIPNTIMVHDIDPLVNPVWRFRGRSFVHYNPCTLTCENAHDIAKMDYEIMRELGYENVADALLAWNDLPTTWDGYHAIARVRNAYAIGTYTSDDYWVKTKVYMKSPHEETPEMEKRYHTDQFKRVTPEIPEI